MQSPMWGVTLQFVRRGSVQLAADGAQSGGARRTLCVCGAVCPLLGLLVSSSVSR